MDVFKMVFGNDCKYFEPSIDDYVTLKMIEESNEYIVINNNKNNK